MVAGQGKGPCPDYVTLVGVPCCVDFFWPCADDVEEIDMRQLHVCGAHAREGLAGDGLVPLEDDTITGLLVLLLGLLVTLRFKKERLTYKKKTKKQEYKNDAHYS